MQRDLGRLADEEFDLLVIGGGIMGACLARDAALRGLKVALVERHDFANATSAHNSKLIHGGLRYLRNFELGLVRESLQERAVWLSIAPHLVHSLPFLLPVTSAARRASFAAGLTLYDMLATSLGKVGKPQQLPSHVWIGAAQARSSEPALEIPSISGAFRYFDAQMESPERLALACLLEASEQGAAAANYLEAECLLQRDGIVRGARLRDGETDRQFDVRARITILALGPWTDLFVTRSLGRAMPALTRSKGIHLLVPRFTRTHALTIATNNGSHFFAIPWRNCTLLGTTDAQFDGNPDSLSVDAGETRQFLEIVNAHLPAIRLTATDVKLSYAGLRALVQDGADSTYKASRRAELIDFERTAGLQGLMGVIGGKWTTARRVAEKAIDSVLRRLDFDARSCSTDTRTLPKSRPGDLGAQIERAVREEMAVRLEDVVMRRTNIGQEGELKSGLIDQAATIMAREAGWSETKRRSEIASVASVLTGQPQ